jgi:dolichol-phosphate mannosyltransferase
VATRPNELRPGPAGPEDEPGGFRVSFVIPARNEEESIGRVLRQAEAALAAATADYEILVVDDGSTDRTADIVRAAGESNPRVRLVQHPRPQGLGAALRTGAGAAALDLVAFGDAGGCFDLGQVGYLLPLTRRYAVTCGYDINTPGAAYRRFLSRGYSGLVALLTGSRVRDADSAIKIVRHDQLPAILPESDGPFGGAELLARARLVGLTMAEVGMQQAALPAQPARAGLRTALAKVAALLRFWWSRVLFPAPGTAAADSAGRFWPGLLLLSLVAGPLLLLGLSYPLLEPDEGRYAEIVREMAAGGEWAWPTVHHEPFYDKPPLFYWLVGASFRLFGTTDWAARLVPALAAFLTVLATFVFARRALGARAGFLAGLVLALMPLFALCGRIVILDSLLTLFVSLTLFTAFEAVRDGRLLWRWWVASALCCGLGVLTKGPVALVLLGPPLAGYVWLSRGNARVHFGHWAVYFGLALGAAAPGYAAVIARDPRFAYHFFVDQHLVRFFLKEYHVEPAWYFLPVLLAGCLPWPFILVPFTRFLLDRSVQARALRPQPLGFYLLWAAWCLAFFSASSSKLPPYVLPALPALAVLVGYYLDHLVFRPSLPSSYRRARRAAPRQAAAVLSACFVVLGVGGWHMGLVGPAEALLLAVPGATGVAAVVFLGRKLLPKPAWLLCGALGALLVFEVGHRHIPAWAHLRAPLARYPEIREWAGQARTVVVCYGGEWGTIPFYLGRNDSVVNLSTLPLQELAAVLAQHPRSVLVARHKAAVEDFRRVLTPGMKILKVLHADEISVAFVESTPGTSPKPISPPR